MLGLLGLGRHELALTALDTLSAVSGVHKTDPELDLGGLLRHNSCRQVT